MKRQSFDLAGYIKLILPYFLAVLGTFISVMQMPIPSLGFIRPDILLIFVYFWAIYRPEFFPIALIFLTTLTVDLIHGAAVGLSPIIHIMAFLVVKKQRRFLLAQSFTVQWLCFCLLCGVKLLIEWGIISAISVAIMPIVSYIIFFAFSCVFYPLIAYILMRIHKFVA